MPSQLSDDQNFLIQQLSKSTDKMQDIDRVAGLLVKSMGDMEFNKKIRAAYPNDIGTKQSLAKFIYKTQDYEAISSIDKKVQINKNLTENGLQVSDAEKLSVKEFAKLIKFADLSAEANNTDFNKKLEHISQKCTNQDFKNLYANISSSHSVTSEIKQNIIESKNYKTNDISVENMNKSQAAKGKKSELFHYDGAAAQLLLSDGYGHAAPLYVKTTPDGKTTETQKSHILAEHMTSRLEISDVLSADILRIDPTKLANKNFTPKLEQAYGPEWQNHIQKTYETLGDKLHSEVKPITNDQGRLKKFADWLSPKSIIQGHTKLGQENDFRKISNEMLTPTEKNKQMICSEFGAVTIASTVDQLNLQISKDLQAKGLITAEQEIFKNPIPKNERLEKIHPGRLVELLKNAGAVEVRNETVEQYVKRNDLTSMKTANIEKDLPNKISFLIKNSDNSQNFTEKATKNLGIYLEANNVKKDVIQQIQKESESKLKEFYNKKNETGLVQSIKKVCKGIAVSLHLREKDKSTKKLSAGLLSQVGSITAALKQSQETRNAEPAKPQSRVRILNNKGFGI